PLLKEIVQIKNDAYHDILRNEGKEVPDASRFVRCFVDQRLKSRRLAIASTALREDVDIFLEMYNIDDLFNPERIITKDLITHAKPHPQSFDMAFTTLGLPETDRSAVCAFEDDPRGIMAARAAGLYVC